MRNSISRAVAVAFVVLAGCSKSPTSAVGPLGEVDLVPKLPAGVAPPPSDELVSHETTRSICGVDGYDPAEIKVRWKSFSSGNSSYIASYAVELTKPADALTVALSGPENVGSASLTPGAPYMAIATFSLKCVRKTARLDQKGSEMIQIKADGTAPLPTSTKIL